MKQFLELFIGGKKRKFTFGIMFLAEVIERDDFEDYDNMLIKTSKNPFKYAPILMYESLKNTYIKEEKEIDFTQKDISDWLEEDYAKGIELMLEFIKTFLGSNDNKTPVQSTNKGAKKK